MSIANSVSRVVDYYRRHGVTATVHRAQIAFSRLVFAGWMVVFYCDLAERPLHGINLPATFRVKRRKALAELSAEELQKITSFWNTKLVSRNLRERFEKGASLWLVECEDQLAGYGWTLQGCTMEPYYFPLAQNDVHLFDFHVFPCFRGRGINPYLIGQILDALAMESRGRAFIEAAEWNDAQLSSLRKTPFRHLGSVRTFTILGHTFLTWARSDTIAKMHTSAKPTDQTLRAARSNE